MGFFDWFTGKGRKAKLDAPHDDGASSTDHAVPMPGGSPPSGMVTPRRASRKLTALGMNDGAKTSSGRLTVFGRPRSRFGVGAP